MVLGKLHVSKVITSWVWAPLEEIFFFWNLILIGLFSHSNTLESHVIKEGQENLKTQKYVQEMREFTIAIYLVMYTYM